MVRSHSGEYTWADVSVHPYKEDGGTHFMSITRQTLFKGEGNLPVELRYFEMQPGGHSTLERHDHQHLVTIGRGCGQVLVGNQVYDVNTLDVVHIPPQTWHQFRANRGEHLGFLCVVSCERDKPHRPDLAEQEALRSNPVIGDFIRV
jgi:hypothetical protein